MKDKKRTALLNSTKDFKGFREADIIVSYLIDPEAETTLSVSQKEKLDRYILINALRLRYRKHQDIVRILKMYDRNERQARTDIAETEYVFGKVLRIDHAFEKSFMLEAGRQNIKIALRTNDTTKISHALKVYSEILGPDEDGSELPDFSKFEQHNYNIVLNPGVSDILLQLVSTGAVDLSKVVPSKLLQKANHGT